MKYSISAIAMIFAVAFLATTGRAQEEPATQPDESWISLTGTVTSTTASSFRLDYGDGVVTVKTANWDDFNNAVPLADGDEVTVYGEVESDLYDKAMIEAGRIYVDDLNTFFSASAMDGWEWLADTAADPGELMYIGTVQTVNPAEKTFSIDTGTKKLTVSTRELLYNPLDDEGFQQIDVGDRVGVDAVIDEAFMNDRDIVATSVVTLED
ncbi:MAG: hypothetical protein RQ741_00490 [Wenzhouxiangellaceae bacterium]|nr:hypothetical protein [Wenzhouxiangellaceae bacterium]